jgi:hypothetical protein
MVSFVFKDEMQNFSCISIYQQQGTKNVISIGASLRSTDIIASLREMLKMMMTS